MRNSIRIALIGAAFGAASMTSTAYAATTATADAKAEVLSTLVVTPGTALNFGQIAANAAGSVTVNADGTVASSGVVSTGTRVPGSFTVSGTANTSVAVTFPSATADLTRVGGTEKMTISNFNVNPAGSFQLNASGAGAFTVGGTLAVASGQAAGTYEGTYSVSVEYQ